MSFDDALAFVLTHEGGLADHPDDPGGLTNYGISLRFGRDIGLTESDIRAMTRDRAAQIYRAHFWDAMRCDALPDGLALIAFDMAVNQGVHAATLTLQESLGVRADGVVGPRTLSAAQSSGRQAIMDFAARRALRYAQSSRVNVFGLGWYRRLIAAYTAATAAMEGNHSGA